MIALIIPDSFYSELDSLKSCLEKLAHLESPGTKPVSHFEKTVMKVVERKKDFQLTGISFTPKQAQVLAVIAENIMPESEFAKFDIRLKSRTEKPFEPTYCGPKAH